MPVESKIRDWLAQNLNFLEAGLNLIKKEQYLPNDEGAAGFIDLFATDSYNRVVAIEIKRSESAAREAITELAKYAVLKRISRKLRKSEMSFVVVSTVWEQLRAPFSEWAHSTDYYVRGYEVTANDDGSLRTKKPVELLKLIGEERKVCRRQFVQYYKDDEACEKAEIAISFMTSSCGIQDFLIFKIKVLEENVYGVTRGLIFAQQLHDKEFYVSRLKQQLSADEFEEILGYSEDLDPDDALDELADHLPNFDEIPRETAEICNPEKVVHRISSGVWEKISVKRSGTFARDERLGDDQLWFELGGLGGTSFTHYVAFARSGDRAELAEINHALETTLFNNPTWRHMIADLLKYIAGLSGASSILTVFDNSAILDSLYVLGKSHDPRALPLFSLLLDTEQAVSQFVGTLRWNGTPAPKLGQLIHDNFDGDFFDGYLMARHFGGHKEANSALMAALGLEFCTDCHVLEPASGKALYDIGIRGTQIVGRETQRYLSILDFADRQGEFLEQLVASFDAHVMQ